MREEDEVALGELLRNNRKQEVILLYTISSICRDSASKVSVSTTDWVSHLTVLRVDCSQGHVQNGAQGFDVVALPVPDGLGQDLQLQVLLLPHVLALGLEEQQGASQRGHATTNARQELFCILRRGS